MSDEQEYWFCLKHHTVEPREGCRNQDRLGPYSSEAEASRALLRVRRHPRAPRGPTCPS